MRLKIEIMIMMNYLILILYYSMYILILSIWKYFFFFNKCICYGLLLGSQFFANPDLRAKRMAQIIDYQFITPEFCQTFLNMSEHGKYGLN